MSTTPQTIGRYVIDETLAQGGMGELYLGHEGKDLTKQVVIKLVATRATRDKVRRFLDEARVATLFEHENIVRVFEVDYASGHFYMVMERLRGWPLGLLMSFAHSCNLDFPVSVIVRIAMDLCLALGTVHSAAAEDGSPLNLVHRDVSPNNVFITRDGVLKLLDFGIAQSDVKLSQTRAGVIRGTCAYMAPEQVAASPRLDARTDIFAIGILLHELLTRRHLFKRSNVYDTLQAVTETEIARPDRPDAPPELLSLVMRALKRDPDVRVPSAEVFGDNLARVEKSLDGSATHEAVARFANTIALGATNETVTVELEAPAGLSEWAATISATLESETLEPTGTPLSSPRIEPDVPGEPERGLWDQRREEVSQQLRRLAARAPGEPRHWAAVAVLVFLAGLAMFAGRVDESAPTAVRESPTADEELPLVPVVGPTGERGAKRRVVRRPVKRRNRVQAARGRLTLNTVPWTNVYAGDKLLGSTPLVEVSVAAGIRRFRLVNESAGIDKRIVLEIPKDGSIKKNLELQ